MKLLSKSNAKLVKGEKLGVLTFGLSLAPYNLSGVNLCPYASNGCADTCLFTAGHGAFSNVKKARIAKAKFFNTDKPAFFAQLEKDIQSAIKQANKKSLRLAIRLNVLSDISWEKFGIIEKFPSVQFYDYTKNPFRMADYLAGKLPKNYQLTFSRSESNQIEVEKILALGGNVAIVFNKLPKEYQGKKVIDGDISDARFKDRKGVIVGLKAKGKAKKDTSGFVAKI